MPLVSMYSHIFSQESQWLKVSLYKSLLKHQQSNNLLNHNFLEDTDQLQSATGNVIQNPKNKLMFYTSNNITNRKVFFRKETNKNENQINLQENHCIGACFSHYYRIVSIHSLIWFKYQKSSATILNSFYVSGHVLRSPCHSS